MTGMVERVARERGIENPVQMTLGVADGSRLLAVRYSSEGNSRSLFHSTSLAALRELYPTHPRLESFPDNARAVVSEPLNEVSDAWIAIPESTVLVVADGEIESMPFEQQLP